MDQLSLCTDCCSDQQDQSSRHLAQMLNLQGCHIGSQLKVVPAVHERIKTLHCLIEQRQLCIAYGCSFAQQMVARAASTFQHTACSSTVTERCYLASETQCTADGSTMHACVLLPLKLVSTEHTCRHKSACTAPLAQRDLRLLAALQCSHRLVSVLVQYVFSTADCFLDQCQRFSTQVEVHVQDCHTGLQQPNVAYTELRV